MGVERVGGMAGETNTRRQPDPVPLCPPQIPHDFTRGRTKTAALGILPLTTCTIYLTRVRSLFWDNVRRRDSAVGVVTGYGLDRSVKNGHPYWFWGPHSLLYNLVSFLGR
jgi:hypothetical protein